MLFLKSLIHPVSILVKQSSKTEQFLKDNKNIEKIIILEQGNKLKKC